MSTLYEQIEREDIANRLELDKRQQLYIPLTPQPLKPWEMFNETLIALGNHNLDMSAGVHEG